MHVLGHRGNESWSVSFRTDISTFEANESEIIKAVAREAERAYLGYVLCEECGTQTLQEVARVTGGLCGDCARKLSGPRVREAEVLIEGARVTVPLSGPRKRYGSRGNPKTRRKVERAKRHALRRLRWLYPGEYDVLLAEERRKAGLDPYPTDRVVRTLTDPPT
jgi:hypothetical protein